MDATRCDVTGPEELWAAIGYEISHWVGGGVTVEPPRFGGFGRISELDSMVYEGRRITGRDDWHALSWAAAEQQRRSEARTASTALAREAEAISKLAESIKSESDHAALDRMLSQLTERTQHAVRQQLRS